MRRLNGISAKLYEYLPAFPIVVFSLMLFAQILLAGKALFWGLPALQFIPWRKAALESILQGSLPFWNPWNGMGTPLLANYQLALFYPPGWLLFLFEGLGGAPAQAWGQTLLVGLHLIWAGLGMSRLLASLGTGRLAQAVAGLAFCLSGYFVARCGVFPMIWTGAWLPWVILTAWKLNDPGRRAAKASWIPIGYIVCVAMLLLAGHAQLAWYTLMLTAVWVLWAGWAARRVRGMLYAGVHFILATCIAGLLASPQLLLTAELLSVSQRASAVDYAFGMQYSFWPWRFLAFFAPNFFGTPADGSYWGYASYWEDAAYIGVLPLLLAISTLKVFWRRTPWSGQDDVQQHYNHAQLSRFLWIVVITSLILALGKNTPVFPFLYRYIPTFDMFQAPSRYLILVVFCLAVLAGIGIEHWRKPDGRKLRWLKRGTVAAGAVAIGAGAGAITLRDVEATFIMATALAGFGALLTALFTLWMPSKEADGRKRWALFVTLFVGIDLLFAGIGLQPAVKVAFYSNYEPNQALKRELNGERVYLSEADEYLVKFWRFFRFGDYRPLEDWKHARGALLPNLNILDNISTVGNFDPLRYSRYVNWMEYVESLPEDERIPWLRMMGVGSVEKINVYDSDGLDFVPVENAFRWYWSGCGIFVENEARSFAETKNLVGRASLNASSLPGVVLEMNSQEQICDTESEAQIELLNEQTNRITFKVNAHADGWLVLSDTWYPGWKAELDGNQTEVIRANYLFRGVVVPEGQHVVVFTYSPGGFYVFLVVSLICWLGVALVKAYLQ